MEDLYQVYEVSLTIVEEANSTKLTTKLTVEKRDGNYKYNGGIDRFIEVLPERGYYTPSTIPNYIDIADNYTIRSYRGHAGEPTQDELDLIENQLRAALTNYIINKRDNMVNHCNTLLGAL